LVSLQKQLCIDDVQFSIRLFVCLAKLSLHLSTF